VIEHHHATRAAFRAIHRSYEERVRRLVAERGVPREKIRLTPEETTSLFENRALEQLLRRQVAPLREAAHACFRESDVSEPYDSEVSKIYHELSILKEEHLSVRDFPRDGDGREFARLFREVSEYYPQRLDRVQDLLDRADRRLLEILPQFRDDTIVLRSSFLFRSELWPGEEEAGLVRLFSAMFPAEGSLHGFLQVARSFLRAGFHAQALECARLGAAAGGREVHARTTHAQQIRDTIRELDKLAARCVQELDALKELQA
jgi:hypothetical protein